MLHPFVYLSSSNASLVLSLSLSLSRYLTHRFSLSLSLLSFHFTHADARCSEERIVPDVAALDDHCRSASSRDDAHCTGASGPRAVHWK